VFRETGAVPKIALAGDQLNIRFFPFRKDNRFLITRNQKQNHKKLFHFGHFVFLVEEMEQKNISVMKENMEPRSFSLLMGGAYIRTGAYFEHTTLQILSL
jgi:hypothetical protein